MSARHDFWSRRKARVAQEEAAELEAVEAAQIAEEHAALEEKSDEAILEELGLPDPDTMSAGDDFKAFMSKAVPDRIRRRALRKLWVSNPALANLDGLLDYGEDFTDSAKVIENLQTAYQVGKGMLAHVEELARQAEAAEAGPVEEAAEEPAEEVVAEAEATEPAVEDTTEKVEVVASAEPTSEPEPDIYPAPRRRMQFAFADRSEGAA